MSFGFIGETLQSLGLTIVACSILSLEFNPNFYWNMLGFGLCQFFSGIILQHLDKCSRVGKQQK